MLKLEKKKLHCDIASIFTLFYGIRKYTEKAVTNHPGFGCDRTDLLDKEIKYSGI